MSKRRWGGNKPSPHLDLPMVGSSLSKRERANNEGEPPNRSGAMEKRDVAQAKLTAREQVAIPKDVRERMGLRPGEQIEFVEARRGFRVQKRVPASPSRSTVVT